MAAWAPWVDVLAVTVLGTVTVAGTVWWCRRARFMARTRPGRVYRRQNTHTGRTTWRAVDGSGKRSRRFRSQQAAARWLARRQGRPSLHLVDRDRYRLECRHVVEVEGPCGPTTGRAWCSACGESRAVLDGS